MGPLAVLIMATSIVGTMGFIPHGSIGEKDPILTEALLREVVERMGKEFNDAASSYLEFPSSDRHLSLMSRANKELENEQLDYDSLIDGNPNPSLRDQEYLQHSSLWGHQYVTGGAGEGEQRLQPSGVMPNHQMVKTDAVLPAYCNPPNPCPVGYTEDQGCISEFENTAAFSREYQLSQHCMCDGEHMFSCPADSSSDLDLPFPEHHKNLVAKKYQPAVENPYLTGERLPIAAKKGFDVNTY
ncbi:neuroendocrine protein 7B2 [Trichoplusia ni]|uniref:Neuroendocrine protein 7B2 n=1 Tax=Trichoplusia ni TaxID=7111 RepID=A0A7E5VX60_TRINI|nr:neuroendocrine protein 7B2 [Trichoplusia ni]XP_026732916.1 neuroendocrine protein 7B2 [Trichoplusia ni]XP_026732917.1 neuroendocrine protein 7B2 [Trichoplusia ni]XP_026732918.1 neuroendocrine protein 7B2 [Trichoplusia ni]XP_026732919.1 neuroendocrine protein 7B2 [Trichoplusia ni]XP_026732920.1 neuroendocrine protein 7B2 [Trichoplusia ni]XP_026732922.1 neuroendocrine protein 7B2 [Trichoplusia ni]